MTAVFCDYYWDSHRNFTNDHNETGNINSLYDGVAALISTDSSSQSSGTSDITEPYSPRSPGTPRSCTPLPATISNFTATRSCSKNSNQPLPAASLTCAPCDYEQSATFQEVTKTSCDNICDEKNHLSDQTCFASPSNAIANILDENVANQNICKKIDDDDNKLQVQNVQNLESVDCSATLLINNTSNQCIDNEHRGNNSLVNIIECEKVDVKENNNENVKKSQEAVGKSSTSTKNENVICQWDKCVMSIKSGLEVVEHLQNVHVASQKNAKKFKCLWSGCKVYNRTSCSLSWLERHVVFHAGNKPFHCIVDGCRQRFTSQGGLERHVNSHFNQPCNSNSVASNGSNASNGVRRKDDTPTKSLKKKRLRYRRKGWAVKTEDFFDSGTMECVQQHLVTLNKTKIDMDDTCRTILFHSKVMARRIESSGKVQVLVHWIPENIFPDQWILESEVEAHSMWKIPLTRIPQESVGKIDPSFARDCQRLRKNRRK